MDWTFFRRVFLWGFVGFAIVFIWSLIESFPVDIIGFINAIKLGLIPGVMCASAVVFFSDKIIK